MWFRKVRYLIFVFLSIGLGGLLGIKIPPIVSVTALIQKNKKLLYLDLSYYKGLGLPGGLVDSGENLEAALQREIEEETGMTIESAHFLGTVFATYKGIPCLSAVYSVETSGELVNSDEGTLDWMHPEDLIDKLEYPTAQLALERYVLHSTI